MEGGAPRGRRVGPEIKWDRKDSIKSIYSRSGRQMEEEEKRDMEEEEEEGGEGGAITLLI